MVLDHVIRGLADEAIQAKVLAMPEVDVTLPKVIKFIESEELAKWSLSDTKAIGPVSGVSSYKKLIKMNKNEIKKDVVDVGTTFGHILRNIRVLLSMKIVNIAPSKAIESKPVRGRKRAIRKRRIVTMDRK